MAATPLDPQTKGLLLAALGWAQSQLSVSIKKIPDDQRDLRMVLNNLQQCLVDSLNQVVLQRILKANN